MRSIFKWALCLVIIIGLIPVVNVIDPTVIPIVQFDSVINKILSPFSDDAWGSSIRRRRLMQMQRRRLDQDACESAGCTGTYDSCWTGEHEDGSTTVCQNSGASTVVATDNGSCIVTNGDVYAKIDNFEDGVEWAPISNTLDTAGTLTFELTTPATIKSGVSTLAWIQDDKGDYIYVRVSTTAQIEVQYVGQHGSLWHETGDDFVAASTTYSMKISWDTVGNNAYIGHAGAEDEDTTFSIDPFDAAGTITVVGPGDLGGKGMLDDGWLIDDFMVILGYDNTQPT